MAAELNSVKAKLLEENKKKIENLVASIGEGGNKKGVVQYQDLIDNISILAAKPGAFNLLMPARSFPNAKKSDYNQLEFSVNKFESSLFLKLDPNIILEVGIEKNQNYGNQTHNLVVQRAFVVSKEGTVELSFWHNNSWERGWTPMTVRSSREASLLAEALSVMKGRETGIKADIAEKMQKQDPKWQAEQDKLHDAIKNNREAISLKDVMTQLMNKEAKKIDELIKEIGDGGNKKWKVRSQELIKNIRLLTTKPDNFNLFISPDYGQKRFDRPDLKDFESTLFLKLDSNIIVEVGIDRTENSPGGNLRLAVQRAFVISDESTLELPFWKGGRWEDEFYYTINERKEADVQAKVVSLIKGRAVELKAKIAQEIQKRDPQWQAAQNKLRDDERREQQARLDKERREQQAKLLEATYNQFKSLIIKLTPEDLMLLKQMSGTQLSVIQNTIIPNIEQFKLTPAFANAKAPSAGLSTDDLRPGAAAAAAAGAGAGAAAAEFDKAAIKRPLSPKPKS